ncbi:beta-galactoside alpha-2,6-sialyltransferase 1-like isoform X2 [Denticeps clupeoides]|uniref:beta-galactoside alpha-2,6-sialyltransferase 1-like isoform X2 n=1 Tax=Denticeps clupeoides TaxID=299321 RepID=UPI0010A505DA|nr:beta-galactoside alpha-2,6-sialyltransferase 1-like isoform X2 [Denticeps clupeoides]
MQTGTKRTWRHISNVSHWFEMSGVGLLSIPAQCCSKYSVIIFCCFVIACIFYLSLNLNLTPKPALKEMWRQMRTAHNAKKPTDGASISKEVKEAVTHYSSLNQFKVAAAVKGRSMSLGRADITCELRARVPLRVIKAGDGPFSGEQWEKSLPSRGLEETLGPLKTCAVVMSSGALRRSSLGMEIDSHDAVLRFNAAPTEGHSRDVGSKTTLRIVNSQLMVTQKARFLQDALFNTGVLIMWDPAPYSKDLHEWYRNPDFNFTETYQDYHRLHPRQPFYILSPSMQWELWDILQEYSPTAIQPNPPSSGMQAHTSHRF